MTTMTWTTVADLAVWEWFAVAGIWLAVLALSVVAGSWVVTWVLRQAAKGDLPWSRHDPVVLTQAAPKAGTMHPQAIAILRGGAWMGVLERLCITGALLTGYPEGVALVVAIKGLGRYAELRAQPVASERFVIGTLASLLWAVVCGLVGEGATLLLLR